MFPYWKLWMIYVFSSQIQFWRRDQRHLTSLCLGVTMSHTLFNVRCQSRHHGMKIYSLLLITVTLNQRSCLLVEKLALFLPLQEHRLIADGKFTYCYVTSIRDNCEWCVCFIPFRVCRELEEENLTSQFNY